MRNWIKKIFCHDMQICEVFHTAASRRDLFKNLITTPLPKTFQWFSICPTIKSEPLTPAFKALPDQFTGLILHPFSSALTTRLIKFSF